MLDRWPHELSVWVVCWQVYQMVLTMRSYHKHKRKKWQWFQLKCYIRGYLYTKRSGTQAGKVAIAVREGENSHDHHAVAISEEDTYCTFKHLLWEISKECFFLLKKGGAIKSKTVEPYIHLMSTWCYPCDDKCSQDFRNFCCSSTIVNIILNTDQKKK